MRCNSVLYAMCKIITPNVALSGNAFACEPSLVASTEITVKGVHCGPDQDPNMNCMKSMTF